MSLSNTNGSEDREIASATSTVIAVVEGLIEVASRLDGEVTALKEKLEARDSEIDELHRELEQLRNNAHDA